MKKILWPILLTIIPHVSYSESKLFYKWGGLDTYHDSSYIEEGDSIDLQNVITDKNFIEKREGSELFTSISTNTFINSFYEYINGSNIRYLLIYSSGTLYQTDMSYSPVLLSTFTAGYDLSCKSAFNKLFCSNGVDNVFWWDGNSSGTYTALDEFPKCYFLEFADERIYCANIINNHSAVWTSEYGNPNEWTLSTGTLYSYQPNYFTFGRDDGESITCFKNTPYGKFVGKPHSIYLLKGNDNDTYYKKMLSNKIGCIDNNSLQMVDSYLTWMSLDGVYRWNGEGDLELISTPIKNELDNVRQVTRYKDSWITNSQSDFERGTILSGNRTFTTTEQPGSLAFSSFTYNIDFNTGTLSNLTTQYFNGKLSLYFQKVLIDDFSDGNYTSNPTWTINGSCPNFSASLEELRTYYDSSTNSNCYAYTSSTSNASSNGEWQITYRSANHDLTSNANLIEYYFVSTTNDPNTTSGYMLKVKGGYYSGVNNSELYLYYVTTGTKVLIDSYSGYTESSQLNIKIIKNGINFSVSVSTNLYGQYVELINAQDSNNYNLSGSYYIVYFNLINPTSSDFSELSVDNIYSPRYSILNGTYTSPIIDTYISTNIAGNFNLTITSNTNNYVTAEIQDSHDGVNFSSWQNVNINSQIPTNISKRYYKYRLNLGINTGGVSPLVEEGYFNVKARYGQYLSPVQYIGNSISKFLTFDAQDYKNNGQIDYFVRGATYSFNANDSYPIWQSQTNHNQFYYGDDEKYYIQYKTTATLNNGDGEIKIDNVIINWQEGEGYPVASFSHDHRYWICVNSSTNTLLNDSCYIYQRNNKWTKFNGLYYSYLGYYDNKPLAGSHSDNGKIYEIMKKNVYSDDGANINSYFVTGNMLLDVPASNKVVNEMWIDANKSNTNLDIGYSINKSLTYISTSTALNSDNYILKRIDNLFDGYAIGRYFRFKFSNNSKEYFRLNNYLLLYDIDKLKPD